VLEMADILKCEKHTNLSQKIEHLWKGPQQMS